MLSLLVNVYKASSKCLYFINVKVKFLRLPVNLALFRTYNFRASDKISFSWFPKFHSSRNATRLCFCSCYGSWTLKQQRCSCLRSLKRSFLFYPLSLVNVQHWVVFLENALFEIKCCARRWRLMSAPRGFVYGGPILPMASLCIISCIPRSCVDSRMEFIVLTKNEPTME